jgi:hypothetical protein
MWRFVFVILLVSCNLAPPAVPKPASKVTPTLTATVPVGVTVPVVTPTPVVNPFPVGTNEYRAWEEYQVRLWAMDKTMRILRGFGLSAKEQDDLWVQVQKDNKVWSVTK